METSRDTSASARAGKPPLQLLSEGQPQKRTSYRRPVDAQPAPVQPHAPPAANTIPSNTARPVAAAPPTNGVSRASSHRRRQSQQIPPPTTGAANESLPTAPDAPRAPPPTAYRDPYAPKGSSRTAGRSHPGRSRDPTLQMNPSRQQPNVTTSNHLQDLRSPPYAPVEQPSGNVESTQRRDSGARKPSVPDRSPLQKLEGKLDDISKEEKRARVLEMELAAQEKAEAELRARRAREAAARQQRNASGPPAAASAAPPHRAASTKRHASLPAQKTPVKSPEFRDLESDDAYAYDLSEPWDPSAGTATGPHRVPSQSKPQRAPSTSQREKRSSLPAGTAGRTARVKGKEPLDPAAGSGSFRDRAAAAPRGTGQHAHSIERKPVAAPTGLGLYGVEDAPETSRDPGGGVARYENRQPSRDLPPAPPNAATQAKRDSRGIKAAQMQMEQDRIDNKQGSTRAFDNLQPHPHDPPPAPAAKRSVGFAEPVPRESEDSYDSRDAPDVFSPDHEPDRRYVAPPMLDEWRDGPVALLGAEDLDLDAPDRTGSVNKAWWEESTTTRRRRSGGFVEPSYDGHADGPTGQTTFSPPLYLKCGPLLRYTGLRKGRSKIGKETEIWRGSVMIVTIDQQSSYQKPPTLRLFKQPMDLLPPPPAEVDGEDLNPAYVDPLEGQTKVSRTGKTLYAKPVDEIPYNIDLSQIEDDTGLFQDYNSSSSEKPRRIRKKDGESIGKVREIPGIRLHAERGVTFWRFNLEVELGSSQNRVAYKINHGPAVGFWVPAKGETMNMMFHSCNGFSLSVDSREFCGPDPLWRDVLNNHQTRPFHVMIGGGDQIYNDAAMRQTTLFKQWTESKNPMQKRNTTFSSELQNELEQFYLDRYSMWFSQGLFGMANSQIPMVNIWDDHDIIDGYGSYPHHFMQTPVFTGLGAVAFKYYMLFQHQSISAETTKTEPSWVLGAHPGPYIKEQSRSVFMQLGRQVAFLGIDCRTERQRDEILTEDSYDVIFDRLEEEIIKGETKHLIVLLGVPIAYPRLNFLENILTSRVMDPVKALGRTGLLGGFVNKFDGGVEILDDLDDHWTAKHHKDERNWLIRELQHIASTKSVRVTILGGDVHLAAVGQFYTNKKVGVAKDKDHRYMPNVVSSAIVNTPPPEMMADILNKRNKVHHLDPFTDEDMIPLFTHDTDGKKRNNNHLLPRRNWCSLREYKPGSTPPSTPSPPSSPVDGPRMTRTFSDYTPGKMVRRMSAGGGGSRRGRDRGPPVSYYNNPANVTAHEEQTGVHEPHSSFSPDRSDERPRSRRNSITALFRRRASVDSAHEPGSSQSLPAAHNRTASFSAERPSNFHRRPSILNKNGNKGAGEYVDLQGGLDICLNLEVSQHDPAGITTPYRLLVPALDYTEPDPNSIPKERRKSRIGSVFGGVFGGGGRKRTVGDDGYSHSEESDEESQTESDELGEIEDEEHARQRYKVGPRIVIPGFSRNRDREQDRERESAGKRPAPDSHAQPKYRDPDPADRLQSGLYANPTPALGPVGNDGPPSPPGSRNNRQSLDASGRPHSNSAWENVAARRHASAPMPAAQTQIPSRSLSSSNRRGGPNYNSSHKSQLPGHHPSNSTGNSVPPADPAAADPKVHRRSMGGILNQHRGEKFEHDAHILAHQPSTRSKRESYPPHPAIVGAGPGSPYSRGGLTSRDGAGTGGGPPNDYFASGGRNGAPTGYHAPAVTTTTQHPQGMGTTTTTTTTSTTGPTRTTSTARKYGELTARSSHGHGHTAGVGAKYLGRGRYAGDDDDDFSDDYDSLDDSDSDDRDLHYSSHGARARPGTGGTSAGTVGRRNRSTGGAARSSSNRRRSYSPGDDRDDDDAAELSQESFVPPKPKKRWQIWK